MLPKPLVTASLRPIILTLLDDRPMYGYEIIQRVHALSSAPMAPALLNDYPEILAAVRVHPSDPLLVGYTDKRFYENRFFFAAAFWDAAAHAALVAGCL